MCGIVGIVTAEQRHPTAVETLRQMAKRLEHRGPDADGFYDAAGVHLGMRRLAVIDLSTGDQPIYNEDRTVAVVFNGEIYNYQDLRQELLAKGHEFETESDTEVIAHLYEEEGLDAFGRLNGMFGIALHDVRKRRVVVARDPHGIKPVFWMQDRNGVRFASEIKAIHADRSISRQPDLEGLADYLVHWYVPTPRSAFVGLNKLPPGHLLLIDEDSAAVSVHEYPRPRAVGEIVVKDLAEAKEAARAALEDAVRRQLIADVPVGIFLSGGLDSALIGTLAARLAPERLRAFTVSFGNHESYDEAPVARAIAAGAGLDHVLIPFPEDPTEPVRDALGGFDEPFGDYSAVPTRVLCRQARQFATVCLAGDGGDEVFAGYTHYLAPGIASLYRTIPAPLRPAVAGVVQRLPTSFERISFDYKAKRFVRGAEAPPLEAHLLYKAIFLDRERRDLLGPQLKEHSERHPMAGLWQTLDRAEHDASTLLRRLLMLDRATFLLDDGLVKVDRSSMASSLEVRVPMLDHVVVDTVDQLPENYLLRRRTTKALLREVAKEILPPAAARLKKKGFTPPMPYWLAGPLSGLIDEILAPEQVKKAGLVEPREVERMVAEHRGKKRDRCRELWTLMSLHHWWQRQRF